MSINVLYIAGAGRSGSTFLSLLLTQHDGAQNIGQIRDLPDAIAKSEPCSCDRTVPDCLYWSAVVQELTRKHGRDVMQKINDGMTAFGKAAGEDTNWDDAQVSDTLKKEHSVFLAMFEDMYAAASAQAGGRLLIDSSKSVDLALALSLIPGINVRILNLIRDPRAVAVSWSKVLKRPMVLRRRTRNWAGRQKRLKVLESVAPEAFMQLRYEDLTVAPQRWISEIQKWAGLSEDLSFFTGPNDAKTAWDRSHLFPPANASVLKTRKQEIHIAPATSWQGEEHAELHKMAEKEAFPVARSYGYRKGVF
ncbi:MAG: hypothetical protein ACI91Z_000056 [Yoonia sp.]|jgi:hypothetical protein